MKKTQLFMNTTSLFRFINIGTKKNRVYEFWYDYVKSKYRGKTELCYLDTDSYIVYIKAENI